MVLFVGLMVIPSKVPPIEVSMGIISTTELLDAFMTDK